ncbi:YafY family protein [Vogesella sp. LIG4]|uniref:helix-turn-helix transcriptional regulator n=1 Tax=Vogesella sp. LIG4 TaxID=1192162 RepID=UPI00081FBF6D|nr:YafY family protein [Vogesella sp. LIG4]SCK13188.1 Predicted transcriptional regulator [Vogesella sp. LIG4]
MRRADRLLQILLLMRGRRRTTAAQLAAWLEVSPRTVYRDMAALLASGAPLNGEAGEGYWLEAGFTPPPISFDTAELAALEAGARMLAGCADSDTAAAAASALQKIHAVLGSGGLTPSPLFVPPLRSPAPAVLTELRQACEQQRCLQLHYRDEGGRSSEREVAPLGLFFWGEHWTLAAWCRLRQAYRHFRTDRIQAVHAANLAWPDDISLDGFLQQAGAGTDVRQRLQQQTSQPWHRR